jgi:hypothetical protein
MTHTARRILLHPGFHKTGTSSIQQFFWINREGLAPQLQLYLLRHLRPAADLAMRFARTGNPILIADMVEALDAVFRDHPPLADTLLLSCEGLSGHLPGWPGVDDYAAAPITIAAVATYLADRFPVAEIAVLLTTRAPGAWLHSAWRHHLAGQRLQLDFPQFAARHAQAPDLAAVAADIAEAIAPVRVLTLPLEQATQKPLGPGGAVLDLIDLPEALRLTLTPAAHSNPGPDAALAADLLALNRSDLPDEALAARKTRLRRAAGPTGWIRPPGL